MGDQLKLFPNLPIQCKKGTIQERFVEFARLNPHVEENLTLLAQEYHAKHPGRKIRIAGLYEELRDAYDAAMILPAGEEYKLNNSYRSRYAREIEKKHSELAFTKRKLVEKV